MNGYSFTGGYPPRFERMFTPRRLFAHSSAFTWFKCVRGTNSLEGGVHQNIIRKFGSLGAEPELTDCALTEYRLRHNTDAGALNRLGYEHKGHYDPWLNQVIEKLWASLLWLKNSAAMK
ncbi:hypothetical protein INT47_004709 [Mucor saturninus]|uniref:Uncharacterized protein n=1 Tax=Mucor saturninus TaxID=64648 RepID=A0A8H7URS7_9FUNG|nr:hypothetical protein INT47_004709 [Mucor saturninus]